MTIVTDERCVEYRAPGHPERPQRVGRTLDLLRQQKTLEIQWAAPAEVTEAMLLRAHTASHLARLSLREDFDGDTPAHPGIEGHARRAVGAAVEAMRRCRVGEPTFSLMRPPGHHATRSQPMGFCYLGSLAIAALEARATGLERVARCEFDVHHGNGTEDIVAGQGGVTFASVHQHPCYPGTGTADVGGNCFNFPVAPRAPREEWRAALGRALERVRSARPQLIGVSAGFDAYVRDPLANGTLEREDFHWLGGQLRALGVPTFHVLEGGYSTDLPDLVFHYLLGLAGKEFK
jgi:acetoin utilization deacetylase AcuC-like enzyme